MKAFRHVVGFRVLKLSNLVAIGNRRFQFRLYGRPQFDTRACWIARGSTQHGFGPSLRCRGIHFASLNSTRLLVNQARLRPHECPQPISMSDLSFPKQPDCCEFEPHWSGRPESYLAALSADDYLLQTTNRLALLSDYVAAMARTLIACLVLAPLCCAQTFSAFRWIVEVDGSGSDQLAGLGTDAQGNIYLAGTTQSPNFQVQAAVQNHFAGGSDVFVAKLAPSGNIVYSTYFGGSGSDVATAMTVDPQGGVYVTGTTTSTDFPTTPGAYSSSVPPSSGGGAPSSPSCSN